MIHDNAQLIRERNAANGEFVGYAYVETRLHEYRATTLHDAMVMWCSARVRYNDRDDSEVQNVGII